MLPHHTAACNCGQNEEWPKDVKQDVKDVCQGPLEPCGDPESVFKDACPRGPRDTWDTEM